MKRPWGPEGSENNFLAGSSQKLGARNTAGRLVGIVDSLERKESDPARQERIRVLSAKLASIATENEADLP